MKFCVIVESPIKYDMNWTVIPTISSARMQKRLTDTKKQEEELEKLKNKNQNETEVE